MASGDRWKEPPARDRRGPAGSGLTCGMVTASLIQVDDTRGYVTLALLVALLAGLAAGVNRVSGLGHGRDDLVAALRATVQLAVVGLVIAVVLQSWWLTTLFVAVMVSVASVTAGRRLARGRRWVLAAIPVCGSALPGGRSPAAQWAGTDDADRGGSDRRDPGGRGDDRDQPGRPADARRAAEPARRVRGGAVPRVLRPRRAAAGRPRRRRARPGSGSRPDPHRRPGHPAGGVRRHAAGRRHTDPGRSRAAPGPSRVAARPGGGRRRDPRAGRSGPGSADPTGTTVGSKPDSSPWPRHQPAKAVKPTAVTLATQLLSFLPSPGADPVLATPEGTDRHRLRKQFQQPRAAAADDDLARV